MAVSVLIDATNLRSGGAIQVAASFLDELAEIRKSSSVRLAYPWISELSVEATPQVIANLSDTTLDNLSVTPRLRRPLHFNNWTEKPKYDVAFSIFGPVYGRHRGHCQVTGFADVTSLFDSPPGITHPPLHARLIAYFRRGASIHSFRRSHRIVVEAPHVREALASKWDIPYDKIDVVPNCVNGQFRKRISDTPVRQGWCYVTRAYPHKNINFLGKVGCELRRRGVNDLKFTLTLTNQEWQNLDEATRQACENVGPVLVEELPLLYSRSEGSVFPSLLECFSVAPLEALATGTPLIASDRAFVHDVCEDGALYADPYDPAAWAEALIRVRTDSMLRSSLTTRGYQIANNSSTPRTRAEKYLSIINREIL